MVGVSVRVRVTCCLLGGALASVFLGCGGGGTSLIGGSPATAITMDAGTSVSLTASVVNDIGSQGVSWSLNGPGSLGTSVCGPVASSTQCIISYTAPATVAAATAVVVTATSNHTPSQSVAFNITVNPALLFTTSTTLPTAVVNSAYSTTLAATGGTPTLTYSLAAGSALPASLTLSSAGVLSGTPTVAGTYTFTVQVKDISTTPNIVVQTETLIVNPAPPVITTTSLPVASVGVAYSQQLSFSGGTGMGTYSVASGALPAGLTLSSTGLISGTPTAAAGGSTYTFTVQVMSGTQTSAAQSLSIKVTTPPVVSTTSLPAAALNTAYSQQLAYTAGNGGAVSWAITSGTLPPSLTLSTSGVIAGVPTQLGLFSFSVAVTVGGQTSANQALSINVSNLSITSPNTAYGEAGLAFRFAEAVRGGTGPYTWTLATGSNPLPTGLTLAAATGAISGTPTTAATTTVTIQVTDATGTTTSQAISIIVSAARSNAKNSSLLGQYAFVLSGYDATGTPATAGGTFIADGAGNITSGTLDLNGTALATPLLNQTLAASTFTVGADGRGKLTLTTATAPYTFTIALRVAATPSSGGYMNEFDSTGRALSGVLFLQSPTALTTATINGGYTFGMGGFASATLHTGIVGELQTTGATGTVNSGEVVSTLLGANPVVSTAGTYSVVAGRGTASITLTGGSKLNLILYPVSATQLLLLTSDAVSATTPVMTGQAAAQTITNGSFSAASLSGVSVLRLERTVTTAAGPLAGDLLLGLENFSGAGSSSFAGDENVAGVASTVNSVFKYTVAANGRVALTPTTGIGGCLNCASTQTASYLSGVDAGFLLDFGAGNGTGTLEAQTTGTLTGAYTVGTVQPLAAGTLNSGVSAISTTTAAFTLDAATPAMLSADLPLSFTAAVASSGRIALTGPSTQVLYEVSPTRAIGMDLLATQPVFFEVQQ